MKLYNINKKFLTHFLLQGTAAVIFMYCALFAFDLVGANNLIWAAGASSLASSCFLVFGTPNAPAAKTHRILIGYFIAMLCGHSIQLLVNAFNVTLHPHLYELMAVISMGLSFFLMVVFKNTHPPAAGLAILMVLSISNYNAMYVIAIAAVVLALIHLIFSKRMQALI